MLAALMLLAGSLLVRTETALAASAVTFASGGSATLNADGSIEGSCSIRRSTAFALFREGDPSDPGPSVPTSFYVTMPDGQTITAYCQDRDSFAPRDGDIPFTAYPNEDGYRVWIWGNRVEANPDEVAAWNAAGRTLLFPPQRLYASEWTPSVQGEISLEKRSSDLAFSLSNTCYSLKGAVYGIYADSACTKEVARLITDASGCARSGKLDAGTYWIKELSPSKGFALDESIVKIEVAPGETVRADVSDQPQYQLISLLLTKIDAHTLESAPQGSASLGGARFLVRFFGNDAGELSGKPLRTWIFSTDDEGRVLMDREHLVSGDDFFLSASGDVALPLGTLSVQELAPPPGYLLEGQASVLDEASEAPVHVLSISSSGTGHTVETFEALAVPEQVKRGGLSVHKNDSHTVSAQGDGSLEGVVFEVVNRSEHDVVVSGLRCPPGEVAATLITDSSGNASTEPDALPLGTYEVREAAPGVGYLKASEVQAVAIDTPGSIKALEAPFSNEVIRGGVRVGKVGLETLDAVAQGGAALAGARFSITSRCDAAVLVDGALCQPGSVVATIVSDEQGIAELSADALPYGTYEVREAEAPQGYLLNESWSQTIHIRNDGEIVDVSAPEFAAQDQVKRGGLSFNKVDEASMESMPGVAFLIVALDDPDGDGIFEQHVIVTDENGIFDSEYAAHSVLTNANDAAYSCETGSVDDALLDPYAGLWFSGRTDCAVSPDDTLGALPYGTYAVRELPCAANENHALVAFTLRVTRDGYTVARGTIDDKPGPQISTQLTSGAGKAVPSTEGPTVLTDLVRYENLMPGGSYRLEGRLVDGATGAELGISASKEIVADAASGAVELEFVLDPAALEARTVVACEQLWLEDVCIAAHEDLEDEDQTVSVPRIGTVLAAEEGGSLACAASKTVRLVDTVSYQGLWPGEAYRVRGELVDRDTGEALGIEAAAGFVAEEADGHAEVVFEAPAELVAGRTVVCFETLYRGERVLAVHADIDDPRQTAFVPAIETALASAGGEKVLVETRGSVALVDTVAYRGLEPARPYRLIGSIVDKTTGEPLASGIEATFTPASSEGSVEVPFEIDADACSGCELVAFEDLYCDEVLVARHADRSDEGQTVRIASMRTRLAGAGGEVGEMLATSPTVLIDTVAYRGLTPGAAYTLRGSLMDAATGEPLGIEAETSFTADSASGTAEVIFACDQASIAGKRVVAFETLLHEGGEMIVHADLEDEAQTVSFPRIGTTLAEGPNGRKTVERGSLLLVDTVSYENLAPGTRYTVRGQLVDRATGEVFLDATGKAATGETVIAPEKASGTCTVLFRIDAGSVAEDTQLVAFEEVVGEDGALLAVHDDLDSEQQTVTITVPEPPARTRIPGTGDDTDPLPMRIAALSGASIAAVSTLLSLRSGRSKHARRATPRQRG